MSAFVRAQQRLAVGFVNEAVETQGLRGFGKVAEIVRDLVVHRLQEAGYRCFWDGLDLVARPMTW